LKKGLLTNIKVVQYIQGNGKVDLDMDMEKLNGQMEQYIKENGKIIEHTEKENFCM
jgi:hypothetical protein